MLVRRSPGTASSSCALEQVYDKKADLDAAVNAIVAPEDCNGAAFVLHCKVVGADMFDRPDTFRKLWPKLVRAYALDSLESSDATLATRSTAEVSDWLRRARDVSVKSFPSSSLGEGVRLESPGIVGAGLVVEASPVHVRAFGDD